MSCGSGLAYEQLRARLPGALVGLEQQERIGEIRAKIRRQRLRHDESCALERDQSGLQLVWWDVMARSKGLVTRIIDARSIAIIVGEKEKQHAPLHAAQLL